MKSTFKNKNLSDLRPANLDWSLIQSEMKIKLGTDIYESWLKKINFVEEFNNYNKVSVVKNLHNQIYEKDNIIKLLQKKINSLKEYNKIDNSIHEVEDEQLEKVEELEEVEEVEEDEEEVELYEKKLKPPNCNDRKLKLFLITDDEHRDIYERDDNGEPGEHIGKLIGKHNKPFFF